MTPRADLVACAVLDEFNRLPAKRKPTIRDNGLHEWIPLSGIVAEIDGDFHCLALATGMKCLPASKIPSANGDVLHDWHAEVLTIRTFNRYLLERCTALLEDGGEFAIVEHAPDGASRPFRIKDNVKLHMYCSEAPCGDASMELVIAAQDDATPWETPEVAADATLVGRDGFSQLGIVRRKPGRRDSPPTLSKSCSDKLALKQCTSLLSGLSSLFIEPQGAYIDTLVVHISQYSETGFERAFSTEGRMKRLDASSWAEGYCYTSFIVEPTDVEFAFSRKRLADADAKVTACPVGTAWCSDGFEESLLGGIVQGKKKSDSAAASRMSRRRMWTAARSLARQLESHRDLQAILRRRMYGDIKADGALKARRDVIESVRSTALSGWVLNQGDADFSIVP